ncbi:hypothetical protein D9M71_791040 [compost metagenome]
MPLHHRDRIGKSPWLAAKDVDDDIGALAGDVGARQAVEAFSVAAVDVAHRCRIGFDDRAERGENIPRQGFDRKNA